MTRRTASRIARVDDFSDDDLLAKPQPIYSDFVNALAAKINAKRLAGIAAVYERIALEQVA